MITYPATLPKPLQSDFSMKYQPNILRDSESNGYQEQRLLSYNTPQSLSVAIMLNTVEEYQTWLDFIEQLSDGCDWFSIEMLDTTYKARLQSGKWSETLTCRTADAVIRKISFTLDVEVV